MIDYICDAILDLYGHIPIPHRGRCRIVTALENRARNRWRGIRSMTRRGVSLESDFSVDDAGWILYSYGCLDYWDEQAIRNMVNGGGVCLDIGAHIGYYSLLFSKWVGPTGRVISYEPVPFTRGFLLRNVQKNRASNITVESAAIGNETRIVKMSAAPDQRLGWSTVSDSGNIDVPCTTIDSEVKRLGVTRVDFIKIDVEGYELQALSGAASTIAEMRPKIMFEVNRQALLRHRATPNALRDFLAERNYGLFRAESHDLKAISNLDQGSSFFNVFALPA